VEYPQGPLNGDFEGKPSPVGQVEGRYEQQLLNTCLPLFHFGDVYRTYDTFDWFGVPTTLDRAAAFLVAAQSDPVAKALLNCEDEDYIGAVLGCTVEILRHPLRGVPDIAYPSPRRIKQRLTESVRAVRWHRLAPPFSVNATPTQVDDHVLWDEWKFKEGETWLTSAIGRIVRQGAPARIARGLPLPEVRAEGEPPFVIASRNPNGAVAVGTLGRMSIEKSWHFPLAQVSLKVEKAGNPIGVFGHYKSLTIQFDQAIGKRRIWAQDLAADRAADITSQVKVLGARLILDGALIDKIGLSAATEDDLSDPALVLVVD
jgi:hypothetical protein